MSENVMKTLPGLPPDVPRKASGRPRLFADRPLTSTERARRFKARKREQQRQVALLTPALSRAEGLGGSDSDVRVLQAVERLERMLRGLRGDLEHQPQILRRLTELERLVRGDPGLARVSRATRRRPLGVS